MECQLFYFFSLLDLLCLSAIYSQPHRFVLRDTMFSTEIQDRCSLNIALALEQHLLLHVVLDTEETDCDLVMNVNLKGAYLCSRAAIPHMKQQGGGSIVCIASASGVIGQKNQVAYNVSKHGVIGLVRCMALDHAIAGIRVNAVCPGAFNSPMLDTLSKERLLALKSMHPLGRLAEPLEIAQTVLHIASDESSFTTGSVILVDGGLTTM